MPRNRALRARRKRSKQSLRREHGVDLNAAERDPMPVLFHITSARHWPPAGEWYRGDTLDTQGFIHCSTADQLIAVANRFFRGHDDLIVLVIDEARVGSEIVYENLEGGTELFPHIYGPLPIKAVVTTFALEPSPDGTLAAPAAMAAY